MQSPPTKISAMLPFFIRASAVIVRLLTTDAERVVGRKRARSELPEFAGIFSRADANFSVDQTIVLFLLVESTLRTHDRLSWIALYTARGYRLRKTGVQRPGN